MNSAIKWFATNHVAANLLMLFIIIAGLLAIPHTRKEIIPNVSLGMINITIPYPGASPSEVESAVCTRVEESIFDIEGIRTLTSNSAENQCSVTVEIQTGFDTARILDDIKTRIDAISSFPANVEKPIIQEITIRNRVVDLVISGHASEKTLKKVTERVRDDLLELPDITQVETVNVKPYEISINVSDEALLAYGLTFSEVADAVRRSSIDVAGGTVKTATGDVLLRAQGTAYHAAQFESIPLRANPDGTTITIGDVATVVDGFKESDLEGTYNGAPATMLSVYRIGEQSVLKISHEVKAYIAKAQTLLPDGLHLNIWQDRSEMFKSRLNLLVSNAMTGLMYVFLILVLFLRLRLALWVSAGIAVAFMGALMLLPHLDGSINMISMFAFVLVLGIVVDDAIIVGENIFSQHRQGMYGLPAAIFGTQDVAKPVIFSVLTTIIAFVPILFLPGPSGLLWSVIPIVVISTLLFSLGESLFILPAHLATINSTAKSRFKIVNTFTHLQQRFVERFENFIQKIYKPFLDFVLRWRYATVSVFISLFIIFVVLVKSGWIPMVFFPKVEGDMVVATVRYAQGTNINVTRKTIEHMEKTANDLRVQLRKENGVDEFRGIVTTVGAQPMSRSGYTGGQVGEVAIELAPSESRSVKNQTIIKRWRKAIGDIPQAIEVSFDSSLQHHGPDIDIELSGLDLKTIQNAADALKVQLRGYPGVYDVRDSYESGSREISLHLKDDARNLGLDFNALAQQVRQAFYGDEVERIQRGRDEVRVFVRYPEKERESLYRLENMTIRLPNGATIPLSSVATLNYDRSPNVITRIDRKRIIRVSGYIDSSVTTIDKVMDDLKPSFLSTIGKRFSGIKWSLSGSEKDRGELISAMKRGFYLAIMGIYALLAISFRSYIQPLMVVSAIPFGLIGAILGHMLLGLDISLLSLSGMIAVSGVVVNDNLVLVDFINRARNQGIPIAEAIREAGGQRFRPIFLTSITTFAGLTPLMMEKSVQAQFLIPMAVSLAFGVMFATTVSLLLIPAAYHILEDIKTILTTRRKLLYGNKAQQAYSVGKTTD